MTSPPTANGISLYKKPGQTRSSEAVFSINEVNNNSSSYNSLVNDNHSRISSNGGNRKERSGSGSTVMSSDLANIAMLKSVKSSENLSQLSSLYYPEPVPILGRDDIMISTMASLPNKQNTASNSNNNTTTDNDNLNTPLSKNLETSNLIEHNSNNNFDFTLLVRTFFYQINGIETFCLRYNQILSNAVCDPDCDLYPNFSEGSPIPPFNNASPFRDGPPDGRGNINLILNLIYFSVF
jgi:hypothetical protein